MRVDCQPPHVHVAADDHLETIRHQLAALLDQIVAVDGFGGRVRDVETRDAVVDRLGMGENDRKPVQKTGLLHFMGLSRSRF